MVSNQEKRQVIEKLYHLWCNTSSLRLGQLLSESAKSRAKKLELPDIDQILSNVDDEQLIKIVSEFSLERKLKQ